MSMACAADPSLLAAVRRSGRARSLRAALLVAPAAAFLAIVFLVPIIGFMFRSLDNAEVPSALPRTSAALAAWDREGLPGEGAFSSLVLDLRTLDGPAAAALARRLNYSRTGLRTLILKTRAQASAIEPGRARAELPALDPQWGEREVWGTLRNESSALTPFYLLAALDLSRDASGAIHQSPADRALYAEVFLRTFGISAAVTSFCILFGMPLAFYLASAPAKLANVVLALVLLPFWTSVLVRTTAWVILLQGQGLVNQLLLGLGLIASPAKLIFNRIGVYVAMTHVMLPFFVLPLYGVMRRVPREHLRAAASLGAPPLLVFRRVYLPQILPGVMAGALLVFVTSLGYYITPALVGGPGDQMVSYFVGFFTNESVNWGMAAALGSLLLAAVVGIYAVLAGPTGVNPARTI
jgi:putative spermidine/putrescine transport system permease protein